MLTVGCDDNLHAPLAAMPLTSGGLPRPATCAPFLALLLACAPDSATAFRDALAGGNCSRVRDSSLRDRCFSETLRCAEVVDELERAECTFLDAEATSNPARCKDAGPFEADCRMHLWTASFTRWAPKRALPGTLDDEAATRIAALGFPAGDPAPWSAWYRWTLGHSRPLDRSLRPTLATTERVDACLQTGIALYMDLLNMARDQHTYPCDGGPIPPRLATTADPELDALRAGRTDLCPS